MKRAVLLAVFACICLGLLIAGGAGRWHSELASLLQGPGISEAGQRAVDLKQSLARFQVEPIVSVADARRIGLNLGSWTSWGAEQLSSNIIKNPGFEGIIDRAVVIVGRADQNGFTDNAAWLARADGFWAGAGYDVRSGRSAGQRGRISDSRRTGANGMPSFTTEGNAPLLSPGDVVIVTRINDALLPTHWWFAKNEEPFISLDGRDRAPGSPGARSLVLKPAAGKSVQVNSYLDAIGSRAGKLLPIQGTWRLSFWSRTQEGKPGLQVNFRRIGANTFLDRRLAPGKEWSKTTIEFTAQDLGPVGTLHLCFRISGPGAIAIDDVELTPVQTVPFPFRNEAVKALTQLRPGYLRDWQGQLGETLTNLLAPAGGRRSSRYRPGDDVSFGYSLPDFLFLCTRVQASPWIVLPTTFSDDEYLELGRYLARQHAQSRFTEILVEFGNENWNSVFRPGGIPDPVAHGLVATRAFQKVREGAGALTPIKTIVNGQHVNPNYSLQFARNAPNADILALAPYFQYSLNAGVPAADRLAGLFSTDSRQMITSANGARSLNKEIAVYEVNLHTTQGDAPPAERDPLTVGAASGSALAKVLLDSLALGARRQCVFTFAGFDNFRSDGKGMIKLWGIARDLADAPRLRPSGLAVTMLNQTIGGDLMKVTNLSGDAAKDITLSAFRSGDGWSVAVVSSSRVEREVSIVFPNAVGTRLPELLYRLDLRDVWATNEDAERVGFLKESVAVSGTTITLRMPPYGTAVLLPKGGTL